MKLIRHRMAGFNHLAGPFDLDLSGLPQGVIAVWGGNGQGKTSVALEGPLAGLYGPGKQTRAFASREGTLARYATARDAYIDDVWELPGVGTFRVRVNVDGTRRTTDAVLLQVLPDGSEVPLSDGKTSTFGPAVLARFPSERSLLASAFAGQTRRGSFGELGQKERMELFVELADLAHLERKAAAGRACAQAAEAEVSVLQAAVAVLQRTSAAERGALLAQLVADGEAGIAALEPQVLAAADAVAAQARVCDALREAARQAAGARALADKWGADVSRLERELAVLQDDAPARAHRTARVMAEGRHDAAALASGRRVAQAQAAHDETVREREARIAKNDALLADAIDIRSAVREAAAAQADIERALAAEAETRRQRDEAVRRQADHAGAVMSLRARRADVETAERRAGLLGTVKYGDRCAEPPACPLVTDASAARASLPSLRELAADAEVREAELAGAAAGVQAFDDRLASLRADAVTAEGRLVLLREQLAKVPYLDAAEDRIAEYRCDIARAAEVLKQALGAAEREQADAETALREALVAADAELAEALRLRESRRSAATDELGAARAELLAASADAQRSGEAEAALAKAEEVWHACRAEELRVTAALATAQSKLAHARLERQVWERARAETEAEEARLRVAQDEMLAWRTVAQALGRDGLQRLEVDAAGPVVSDLANQLLEVGYGPRFSVRLVTQVATADGKDVKEKFTVDVLDNLHGGDVRDIGDLSGGERVVVEEALRAALACYVNTRVRRPCRTLWRDEADGGLSQDNVAPYVAMLQKLRELSGADQVLFVTHNEQAASLADAVVRVESGRVAGVEVRS